jgi:hypothetical protein
MALINKISDIAEAVRERSGYTGGLTLEDMAIEIKAIPYPVVEEIEIAENGTYEPSEGVDGFNKVIIDIPIPEVKPAIIEEITITENGTYSAPVGVDGYSPIIVDIPTGGGEVFNEVNMTAGSNGVAPFTYNTLNYWIDGKSFTINTDYLPQLF